MRSFLEDIHDAGVTFDPTDDASMGEDSSYTGTSDSDDSPSDRMRSYGCCVSHWAHLRGDFTMYLEGDALGSSQFSLLRSLCMLPCIPADWVVLKGTT